MGVAFLANKAKSFKHRRDAAFEDQLNTENLFSGLPDVIESEYRCQSTVQNLPSPEDRLLMRRSGDRIEVLFQNKVVGSVMEPDKNELLSTMDKLGLQLLAAEVTRVQVLSHVFIVKIIFPKPSQQ